MSSSKEVVQIGIPRMIAIPALITLAVTLVRLTGELLRWPGALFSTATGGIIPSGTTWIIGITWLAAVFGAYFALRLEHTGFGPRTLWLPWLCAAGGIVVFLVTNPIVTRIHSALGVGFPEILIFVWLFWVLAGALQYSGWPQLFKTLFVYGYAARIPVALVMLFAMLGNWGTHYDYVGMPSQFSMSIVPRFLWLAFFPQLVAWVAFTITLGSAVGIVVASASRLRRLLRNKKVISADAG